MFLESKFQFYRPGGVIMRTFLIDLEEEEQDGPHVFYVNAEDTVYDVKTRLADIFHLNINTMKVCFGQFSINFIYSWLYDTNLSFFNFLIF